MLVAESRMVMGKAHVFHVGSLSCVIYQHRSVCRLIMNGMGEVLVDGNI